MSAAMTSLDRYENETIEEEEEDCTNSKPLGVYQHGSLVSRQESVPLLFSAIHKGDTESVQSLINKTSDFINCSAYGGLTPLHATCHWKHLDILRLLINAGGKVTSYDSLGNTVLHSAVTEKWHEGIKELLQHGASPVVMNQPPSGLSEILIETPLHAAVRLGDLRSTTLLLKSSHDLSIKNSDNCSVFHVAASMRNVQILKLLLGEKELVSYLQDIEKDGSSLYHSALSGEVSKQDESLILRVFQTLQKFFENVNLVNIHGESPLLMACRAGLPNVAKYLLANGGDPTYVTREGETTLHAACNSGCSSTLRVLMGTGCVGHLISSKDNEGHHPFFRAVQSSSVECCKTLLDNGEHLTHNGKDSISNCQLVIQKLPTAMQLLRSLFDAGVKLSKKPQYDPGFSITFDYTVLITSETEKIQSSIISELADSPLESLIKHPLLESFLYIKWCRIRSVFYYNFVQYFVYVLLHTSFVMISFGQAAINWSQYPNALLLFKIFHGILLISIFLPGAALTFANFKKYMQQWETYTRLTAVVTSAVVIFIASDKYTSIPSTNTSPVIDNERPILTFDRGMASASVFFCWVEIMMLLGRFPVLGAYILMFTKVSKSVIKFVLSFSSLLLGFSLSFHILFQQMPVFADYKLSFAKTLMMMTGEIAYSEFVNQNDMPLGTFSLTVMSMFIFMVTVIMSNLLIGLAVNDIPDLKRQGKIQRLVKEASYLTAYEKLLMLACNASFFPRKLRLMLSSKCNIKSVVTVLPNKEIKRYKHNRTIPDDTLREAIALGSCENPEDFITVTEEDLNQQLKAFQIKYSTDRRTQKDKFASLSHICAEIKNIVELQQFKVESQLSQFSIQLQQQIQQIQNLCNRMSQTKPE